MHIHNIALYSVIIIGYKSTKNRTDRKTKRCIHSTMDNSSRGEFYRLFKTFFGLENYLLKLTPIERKYISKLRCCNVKIPVELGRWYNIPKEERTCNLSLTAIGNEYHYLFECSSLLVKNIRNQHIPEFHVKYPSEAKMKGLLSLTNINELKNVSLFISKLTKTL